jgi:hypothetical protein
MACSLHRVRAAGFLEVDYVVPRRRTRKRSIGRDSYSYFMGVSQRLIFCGKGGVAVCDGGMLRLFEGVLRRESREGLEQILANG